MNRLNTWTRIEQFLLPPPEILGFENGEFKEIKKYTTTEKFVYCVKHFFLVIALVIAIPFTVTYDYCTQKSFAEPKQEHSFSKPSFPKERGFATSMFQTAGLGTKWSAVPDLEGECDWNPWMVNDSKHIKHEPGFGYKDFFTDILTDPDPYIQMLKDHYVTAHRFSLEWSVIQPEDGGKFNAKAVGLYRNFIDKLLNAQIKPHITLCHFVVPNWFYKKGNFQKRENVKDYVNFAVTAMETFPEVKDWWSFNELGVKAFQQTREVYPTDLPEGSPLSSRVHAAGISTLNMLIAHCELHTKIARKKNDQKIGVTHQWLKFDMAKGNWLERTITYIFTNFTLNPVCQFFKDGSYSFQFPFMANIQFQIPKKEFEKNGKFLMRLGVQAYPQPMIKMGLNGGKTYPGLPSAIHNLPLFSFGSTCEENGTVMRFGPRWKAEGMKEILDEAFELTDQVYITEFGSDAMVQKWGETEFKQDDQAQADYLGQLFAQIKKYPRQIQGLFCWSDLRRQMESRLCNFFGLDASGYLFSGALFKSGRG